MNAGRAKQILESPNKITVHYRGNPVWIQQVDEAGNTARVYTRDNPDDEMTVNVANLEEM